MCICMYWCHNTIPIDFVWILSYKLDLLLSLYVLFLFFLAIYHLLSCNIWVEFPSDIILLISLMPLSWHSPNASMYLMLLPLYSFSSQTFTMWDVVLNEHKFCLALSSVMFCRITLCLVILVSTCVLCSDSFACTCVCSLTMSIWSMLICYICHMPFYICLSTTPYLHICSFKRISWVIPFLSIPVLFDLL